MKHLSLFCLMSVVAAACSTSDDFETDYKVYEVQGNVKQITYKSLGKTEPDVVVRFNADGMLLSERIHGMLYEYKYDGLAVTDLKVFAGDSLEIRRTYKYEGSTPVEIREFDKKGTFRKKVVYEYDRDGNRTKGYVSNAYNDTLSVCDYAYADGLLASEHRRNYREDVSTDAADGGQTKTYVMDYEARFTYEYDDARNLLSKTEYADDAVFARTYFKSYKGQPLPASVVHYWDGQVSDSTTMTYGFDEKGNWIFKRTVSSRGNEQRQERIISYYK